METKVLIINNDENFLKQFADKLRPYAAVVTTSLNNFSTALIENSTHIIIDGNEHLARSIRAEFKGLMIANSNHDQFNNLMMLEGCDYKSSKEKTIDLILELIDVVPAPKNKNDLIFDYAESMLNFFNSAKNPNNLAETKMLFLEMEKIVNQTDNQFATAELKKISVKFAELEVCPPDIKSKKYCECLDALKKKLILLHNLLY